MQSPGFPPDRIPDHKQDQPPTEIKKSRVTIWQGRAFELANHLGQEIKDFAKTVFQILSDFRSGDKSNAIKAKQEDEKLNNAIAKSVQEATEHIKNYIDNPGDASPKEQIRDVISHLAFKLDLYEKHRDLLNKSLELLTDEAIEDKDPLAYEALTKPHPDNTPLALLVKMGNLSGVKTILRAYNANDLLAQTPLGNTAFHLAIGTMQIEMANTILERAKELGIEQKLLEAKNNSGLTAKEIYGKITQALSLSSLSVISEDYFGGKEVSAANAVFFKLNEEQLPIVSMDSRKKTLEPAPAPYGLRFKTFEEVTNRLPPEPDSWRDNKRS